MVSEKARVKTSSRRPERAPATAAAFRRTWTSGSKISSKMRCGLSRRLRSLNPRMSIIATATLPRTLFCPLRRRRPVPVPRACLLAWTFGTGVLRSNRPTSFSRNDSNSNRRGPLASGPGDADGRTDGAARTFGGWGCRPVSRQRRNGRVGSREPTLAPSLLRVAGPCVRLTTAVAGAYGPHSFALGGGQGEDLSPANLPSPTPPGRADCRAGRGAMKSILITAALVAAAAGPSFAKQVRIPVTRGAGGVPVPCGEDPLRTCHNRWHPDIPAAAEANPGDTVIFETRDAFDNPFNRRSTPATVAAANLNLIHPLTGPLHVRGAKRGDVLTVTMIDVGPGPDNFGYTVAVPGFGFLRDVFTEPAIAHWELGAPPIKGTRFATSRDLPGVRLPLHGFAGTIGVELGGLEIETAFSREADGEGNDAAVPLLHRRMRAFGGRRALGPGGRRGLRHRHRDERDRHGEGRGPQGPGRGLRQLAPLREQPPRRPQGARAGPLHRHHGHSGQARGRRDGAGAVDRRELQPPPAPAPERVGGRDAGGARRAAQDDRPVDGTDFAGALEAERGAGVPPLQRRLRSPHQQPGGRAQLRGVELPPARRLQQGQERRRG